AIVDDDSLPLSQSLSENALERLVDGTPGIECGDDEGNDGSAHSELRWLVFRRRRLAFEQVQFGGEVVDVIVSKYTDPGRNHLAAHHGRPCFVDGKQPSITCKRQGSGDVRSPYAEGSGYRVDWSRRYALQHDFR